MTDAVRQQLAAAGVKIAPAASSAPAKGKTSKATGSDAPTAAETTARREVVGVGRLAWESPVFGLPAYYRKYRLLSAAQADELDAHFFRITGTQP